MPRDWRLDGVISIRSLVKRETDKIRQAILLTSCISIRSLVKRETTEGYAAGDVKLISIRSLVKRETQIRQ